jgi:hypothetical protein
MKLNKDIFLNQLAQTVKSIDEGENWFEDLKQKEQFEVLAKIVFFILQIGVNENDLEKSICSSGLKPTYTPCQILIRVSEHEFTIALALSKIINLREDERKKSFRLLIALFSQVLQRQLKESFQPERYWWHRDLSDVNTVREILKENFK